MEIAEVVAKRSTCLRRQVGAVLVKDRQILATGYNGTPKGIAHCEEVGCLREQLHVPSGQNHELCRGIHAEQNAVIHGGCKWRVHQRRDAVLHASAVLSAPRSSSMPGLSASSMPIRILTGWRRRCWQAISN